MIGLAADIAEQTRMTPSGSARQRIRGEKSRGNQLPRPRVMRGCPRGHHRAALIWLHDIEPQRKRFRNNELGYGLSGSRQCAFDQLEGVPCSAGGFYLASSSYRHVSWGRDGSLLQKTQIT